MTILARFLMLVACLPLLPPPGLCVCKVGEPNRPLSPQEFTPVRKSCPALPHKTSCCSQHQNTNSTNTTPASKPVQPTPRPCPLPPDDNNLPSCPASVGVDQVVWIEPAELLVHALPPVEVSAFLTAEVVAHVTPPINTFAHRLSAPPLYLFQCSLVI
mgnify:CR=1 FL=1